jgi:hypothetical protein
VIIDVDKNALDVGCRAARSSHGRANVRLVGSG